MRWIKYEKLAHVIVTHVALLEHLLIKNLKIQIFSIPEPEGEIYLWKKSYFNSGFLCNIGLKGESVLLG